MMKRFLLPAAFLSAYVYADDLAPLGDEFNSAVTRNQWTQLNDTEGWNANQLELWDFNPDYSTGNMVMAPHSSGWFMDMRGVLVYKEVTGDFIVTLRMQITRRGASGALPGDEGFAPLVGAPSRNFSLAGIFVRSPRNITQAGPAPIPAGVPTWPPPAQGQPGHFVTDWTPDGDNYIFLSMGSAGNAGNWQYEVKTTRDGHSRLYYNDHGIPADNSEAQFVTLQFIKVGNTVVTLRKHHDGPWIVENRYVPSPSAPHQQLPNFTDTLQVGVTTYTDWNSIGGYYSGGNHASQYQHNYTVFQGAGYEPDLIAYIDYFRIQRPDPAITEATLAALPLTFQASPLGGTTAAELPNSGAGIYLGDAANSPTPALESDPDNDQLATLLEMILGTNPATPNASPINYSAQDGEFSLQFPHVGNLNHVTLRIQRSNTLQDDWVTVATWTEEGWTTDEGYSIDEAASMITFTAPLTSENTFYRIHAELP